MHPQKGDLLPLFVIEVNKPPPPKTYCNSLPFLAPVRTTNQPAGNNRNLLVKIKNININI